LETKRKRKLHRGMMGSTNMLRLKLKDLHRNEIRRTSVKRDGFSYAALVHKVCDLFGISAVAAGSGTDNTNKVNHVITLFYKDVDGDIITFSTEEELRALMEAETLVVMFKVRLQQQAPHQLHPQFHSQQSQQPQQFPQYPPPQYHHHHYQPQNLPPPQYQQPVTDFFHYLADTLGQAAVNFQTYTANNPTIFQFTLDFNHRSIMQFFSKNFRLRRIIKFFIVMAFIEFLMILYIASRMLDGSRQHDAIISIFSLVFSILAVCAAIAFVSASIISLISAFIATGFFARYQQRLRQQQQQPFGQASPPPPQHQSQPQPQFQQSSQDNQHQSQNFGWNSSPPSYDGLRQRRENHS